MTYLLIIYKDNGKVIIQEFYTKNAIKIWLKKKERKIIKYDVYIAKCINKEIE